MKNNSKLGLWRSDQISQREQVKKVLELAKKQENEKRKNNAKRII